MAIHLAQRLANAWRALRSPPMYHQRYLPTRVAGILLTDDEVLQVSAVAACFRVISDALCSLPWEVYRQDGAKRVLLADDPVRYLLNTRPNADTTAIAWREGLVRQALLTGNSYSHIQRDGAGRPRALWNLESARVTPDRHPDTGELIYRHSPYAGGEELYFARDIYHLRGPSLFGLMGDNQVFRAAKSIGIASAAQTHTAGYFENDASPGIVLTTPKFLDDATHKRIQEDWDAEHKGPRRRRKTALLEGGTDIKEVGHDPQKSQVIPTSKFQVIEIARFFGVPPHKLMDPEGAQGYGRNLQELALDFVRGCLMPWALRLQQEADYKLLDTRGNARFGMLDMTPQLRGDGKTQAETDEIRIRSGVYSVNEIREQDGANTLGPEGDLHYVPAAWKPVEVAELEARRADAGELPAPAGGTPTKPGGEQEGDDQGEPGIARRAAHAILAGALDRHAARVMKGTKADFSIARLVQDCSAAAPFLEAAGCREPNGTLRDFALYVEHGESADAVANRLLASLERTP